MKSWGSSTFHPDGKIDNCGMDLKSPNNHVIQYMMDYIYITWFVHCISPLWTRIWWTYLLIPLYVTIKIIMLVRSYLGSSQSVKNGSIPKRY